MKHILTVAILVVAIGFASLGYTTGFVILFVAGLLLEGLFWHRVFNRQKPSPTHS